MKKRLYTIEDGVYPTLVVRVADSGTATQEGEGVMLVFYKDDVPFAKMDEYPPFVDAFAAYLDGGNRGGRVEGRRNNGCIDLATFAAVVRGNIPKDDADCEILIQFREYEKPTVFPMEGYDFSNSLATPEEQFRNYLNGNGKRAFVYERASGFKLVVDFEQVVSVFTKR